MNILAENPPDFVSQFNIEVQDDDGGPLGFIAIDRLVRGTCSGGIRMTHDISQAEVRGLANAMTWKFAFMSLPVGGAKSGIICPADAGPDEKQRRLALFGKKISPLLRSFYSCGGDIGVGPAELAVIKSAAGLPTRERPGTQLGGYFTAFGVCSTIITWLETLGRQANGTTAIIEGYGNVGHPLARLLYRAGIRVTGISTMAGGLFNESGIDLDALEILRGKYGDDCVLHFNKAAHLSPSDLLRQDATVLVPGARPWTIHQNNACQLKCKAIISASNIPVTPAATLLLERVGVAVIPEFVSNSGGTFGGGLVNQGFSRAVAEKLTHRVYSARIKGLLRRAEADAVPLRTAAKRIAEENINRQERNEGNEWAALSAMLARTNGFRKLMYRSVLPVHRLAYRLFGDDVQRFPAAFHAAAAEAIYNRVVSESFQMN